jgi:tetratricopeptide (TPR) repeat protein
VDTFADIQLYQSTWAGLLYHLALLRRDQGNLVQARQLLENAVGHQQLVFRANPGDPGYLWEQYKLLGDVLLLLGDHEAASRMAAEWARSFPEDWKALIMATQNQIRCVTVAAKDRRLSAAQRAALGRAYGEAARGLLGKAIQQVRKDPEAQNKIAWFLLTCWDAHFRDPAQALELAAQAVVRQPRAPNYWHTLGVAHYRLGHWQAAIDALDKEIKFRGGPDSTDGFFLAMARWQLGDKEGANLCFDRAVWGMRNEVPGEEEARRVRDEASALLGKSKRR